jgi:hypothetical protein
VRRGEGCLSRERHDVFGVVRCHITRQFCPVIFPSLRCWGTGYYRCNSSNYLLKVFLFKNILK